MMYKSLHGMTNEYLYMILNLTYVTIVMNEF